MDGGIIAIDFGKMIPLSAGAKFEDQAVENLARVFAPASGTFGGIVLIEEMFKPVPKTVWGFPDCRHSF